MSDTNPIPDVPQIASEAPQIDPYMLLTPGQRAVYALLDSGRQGVCRRDFAAFDIWEPAARILEIERRLGITVGRDRCAKHTHRHRVVRYTL